MARKKERKPKECPICGYIMWLNPSNYKKRKYCSRECARKGRDTEHIDINCSYCGKPLNVPYYAKGIMRCCDDECWQAHKLENPSKYMHKEITIDDIKNRKFSDMTLTLVASNEIKGKDYKDIIKGCNWDKKVFYEQLALNMDRINKRKALILARK